MIFLIHFLSVCGLDFSAIYGASFRVLVIGLHWRFGRGSGCVSGRCVCDMKWYVVLGSCPCFDGTRAMAHGSLDVCSMTIPKCVVVIVICSVLTHSWNTCQGTVHV